MNHAKGQTLEDGTYVLKKRRGKGRAHFIVKDGVLWLPAGMNELLCAAYDARPMMLNGKKTFVRAKDAIEFNPKLKAKIEELAADFGVSV
jgi:hypothetical protein